MRVRRKISVVLVAGALLAVVISHMWIDRMVFFPEREVPSPPGGVEDRWFAAEDGVRLHAWWAASSAGAPTLVWSHGNGGNIADRADVLLALQARGLSVLAYDYRGYGRSAGEPSERGVYLDVLAAYDSLRRRRVPPRRIIAFGESIGGAVSIYLAGQRACAGVAVVSTFTSLRDVARSHFGPLAALVAGKFDSLDRIAGLSVPFFAAHGERDEIVPFDLGRQLHAAAPEPKRFLRVPWAHHNDIFAGDEVLDEIAAFARAAVAREGGADDAGPSQRSRRRG